MIVIHTAICYIVGSMQECRKWHFGWNWVLYRYWKYIQKHKIQALHQVPTQTNDTFRAKIRCQKTGKNKGILSIKWLLLQNDQNALTTLLHWADDMYPVKDPAVRAQVYSK